MINSLCGSMGSLRSSTETSCSKPVSPTASVSESNIVASELDHNHQSASSLAFDGLKFDVDVEVQSPDSSIWETLFAEQIDSSPDFMISSPKRDFMVCSPKREYMVSSPKREYMVSSPKREYMVSSPKRTGISSTYGHNNYAYAHGVHGHSLLGGSHTTTHNNKGKSQSPLHKLVFTSSTPQFVHGLGESLSLPSIDGFLDDYQRENYDVYPAKGVVGVDCPHEPFEMPMTLPTLLDYLPMPTGSRFCGSMSDTTPEGLPITQESGDLYQMNHFGSGSLVLQQRQRELDHGLLGPVSCKSEQAETSYHGLLGPIASESEQEQDSGLQLVHLLLACAEMVAKEDYMSARRFLHHLNRVVSPLGDSMQRVASCFTDALTARLAATSPSTSPKPYNLSFSPPCTDTLKVYQILYQACPYIKFAHFTANQAIFEAFEGEERVHIIDLDILQGYQWPAFMQALAARPGGAPFLRITGVGSPLEMIRETGRHLTELAHSLRVPFEFHSVGERIQDLQPHMFHRRVGEALAVNSVNQLHRVPGTHLGNIIGMIRDQAPNIVTLVEQEASHNGPFFLGRFLEALHYYSAIFDSLDATFPPDSVAREKVEQCIFAAEIRNIVAWEGVERVERHEKLEKWRKVMEGKGFKGVPLSSNAVTQSKILLGLYSCDGYTLAEDKGCLLLGWQDRAIIAASAWRC